MRNKLVLLIAVLLFAGALAPSIAKGSVGISIHVGDYPYYTHGPWYWRHGARWYWVPGYWKWRHHHRVWIHGYYAPRHGYYAPYRYYRYY